MFTDLIDNLSFYILDGKCRNWFFEIFATSKLLESECINDLNGKKAWKHSCLGTIALKMNHNIMAMILTGKGSFDLKIKRTLTIAYIYWTFSWWTGVFVDFCKYCNKIYKRLTFYCHLTIL